MVGNDASFLIIQGFAPCRPRLAGRVAAPGRNFGRGAHGAVRQFDKYPGLVGGREGTPYYI